MRQLAMTPKNHRNEMEVVRKNQPITRSFHCKKCEQAKRPKVGDKFVTYGSTGRLKIRDCTIRQECQNLKTPLYGMTPHIITVESSNEDTTVFIASCAMDGCGVEVFKDETFDDFEIDVLEARTITMNNKDFVNFKNYKDQQFYI